MQEPLDYVRWDDKGLVPVVAQEYNTGIVLMFAWMNREALALTMSLKRAVYYSRSRQKLWFKGEESGHVQHVKSIKLDCDQDVVLLTVVQDGGIACHTGRHNCFFEQFDEVSKKWVVVDSVIKSPSDIYVKK